MKNMILLLNWLIKIRAGKENKTLINFLLSHNLPPQYLQKFSSGKANPSLKKLIEISELLHVRFKDLFLMLDEIEKELERNEISIQYFTHDRVFDTGKLVALPIKNVKKIISKYEIAESYEGIL